MNYANWNRPHRAKRKRRWPTAEVGGSAAVGRHLTDLTQMSNQMSLGWIAHIDRPSQATSPPVGLRSSTGCQMYGSAALRYDQPVELRTNGDEPSSGRSIGSAKISVMKARRTSCRTSWRTGSYQTKREVRLGNVKSYNRVKSELRNKENGQAFRRTKKYKWALFRWSTIFLFIIQLTYIAPAKATDGLPDGLSDGLPDGQAATKGSTKDLIRFTIDRHHSTYSTYFGDLYTTPIYSLFYTATNSLAGRTTRTPLERRHEGRIDDANSGSAQANSRSSNNHNNQNNGKSDNNGESNRKLNMGEELNEELNEELKEQLNAKLNAKLHGDWNGRPNSKLPDRTTSRARRTTSRTTSSRAASSTTTKAFAKQIKDESSFLTANKQIQSIKFDSQYPWPKQLHAIYKDAGAIDFEFNHRSNAKKKRRNVTEVVSWPEESSTDPWTSQQPAMHSLRPNLAGFRFDPNRTTVHTPRSSYETNYDFRTTNVFIPYSSPMNEDHYSSSYFGSSQRSSSTNGQVTTKLPRIKKNSKEVSPEQSSPVHLASDKNSNQTGSNKSDGLELMSREPGMETTLSDLERNRTITEFLNEVINGTNSDDKLNDSSGLNETYVDDMRNQTLDSPFLIWLGQYIAHPSYEKVFVTLAQITCLLFTIIGNVLVIISIFTYNPLRNVQNMFLVSLAVSDITVAVCILPLNVAYYLIEKWVFGIHLCMFWLTSDILCCTASILNLCAIAVDRYQAIHDPINYRMKRTTKRVLFTIVFVWVLSAVTSIPPLLGWNDWPEKFTSDVPCRLTSEKGFVVFSSSVSFYIPLVIMTTVYVKIFLATKERLRKRAQSTARVSMKRGTKKSPLMDVKQFPAFEPQKYLVDGHLVEVTDGQAASLLQNYLQKGIISADNENKLYVQLAAQSNQSTGPLSEENRIATEIGSLINQQHSAQHSSSTSHLPGKSDSGTTGSSTAAVIRVTNLLGAIKGSRNLTEHRQRQYSVTEPNTSSSNDEVVLDYTTVNDGQHSLCLMSGKQLNAIEFDPASLQLTSTFQKDTKYDAKSFGRKQVKRQSTPEEASDSSESLVDKETEFSSNNGPHYEQGGQQADQAQQTISQQQSVSHPSLAKSFKNRFQHTIFHHQQPSSSTPPTTTLSVHYSSSQTSFSNTSSALQQPPHHTKFSSFNLLRRYRSRFHRANNATCFSNFEASSHSRPSIGVVSATSTPEVTSPSGNSPKAGDQSPNQLPDLKEEPHQRTINRNYLSATFKSTTCSALSKIAANKSKTMNKHLTSSLHTLNVAPAPIHRAKSEDANNYGLLHAVSQKLLEEQTLANEAAGKRRKSLSQKRLSICSIGTAQPSSSEQTTENKMRSSNSCLNVSSGTRSNTHRDSTTSYSVQKTSETTQKTSSGQTGQMFTSSSGPSSGVIQPEKVSQNSNVSSHSNNSNAISECNQRCLSPASMLQLPHRKHHSDKHQQREINIGSSESNLTNLNKQGTSSNSARNHSSNSNYYSYTSTTSTSILTTSQMQPGYGSGATEQSAAIGSGGVGSSFNQSMRHPSNAYSSHSMVKQVWSEKQRISLSKERKAAQVLGIVMGAFVISWLPFFLVYTFDPFFKFELSEFTIMIFTWLGYINSSINPIIYTIFNMDFRIAFKRIFMKCCCTGKWRQQQKLYQQQQQIRINKRKEHKKKKLLHQQQKQKLREQKASEAEKDSFNTSRKSSFREERKSSLKPLTNSSSVNKIDDVKRVRMEQEKETNGDQQREEANLKMLAKSLTCLDRIPEVAIREPTETENVEVVDPAAKPVISISCDNLNGRARLAKERNRILRPLTNGFIFRTNSSLKKSRSEITNITTSYERTLRSDGQQATDSLLDDNNNNEQSNEPYSSLTEIIIKTNLRQLENNNADYCYFNLPS